MIDLLVVGGGPAGLATAAHAALAGLETVVIEPRTTPVDKACGEGVMPSGVRALSALGLDLLPGHPLRGIRYVHGTHRAEAPFDDGPGLGVRRTELHAALARRAAEAGVRTVTGRVGEVEQSADSVTAGGLRARWLVAADGLRSPVRHRLGLDLPDRRPRRYGQRRHYRMKPWTDFVEVHWSSSGRAGEAYVTPLADDLVGVAVLTTAKGGYDDHLAGFPRLLPLLDGEPVGAVRGAGPCASRYAAAARAGCCSSATRPGMSTPSPARASRSRWPRRRRPYGVCGPAGRRSTSGDGARCPGATGC